MVREFILNLLPYTGVGKVEMEGAIVSDTKNLSIKDLYRIRIGTETGYEFEVKVPGVPAKILTNNDFKKYLENRNIIFGPFLDSAYEVMGVLAEAEVNKSFSHIRDYVTGAKTIDDFPDDVNLGFVSKFTKRIKSDIEIIKRNNWLLELPDSLGDAAVKDQISKKLNYPGMSLLIERIFIENAACLD